MLQNLLTLYWSTHNHLITSPCMIGTITVGGQCPCKIRNGKSYHLIINSEFGKCRIKFIEGRTYDGQHGIHISQQVVMVIPSSVVDKNICRLVPRKLLTLMSSAIFNKSCDKPDVENVVVKGVTLARATLNFQYFQYCFP